MDTSLTPSTPAELGVDPDRWAHVSRLAESFIDDRTLSAVSIQIIRGGRCLEQPLMRGRQRVDDKPGTLRDDAIFLVASLTKPVVAMATLLLIERGRLTLNDRVVDHLPEFESVPRRPMTVRHLLTHTSGLPDMLPNNRELRETNSPLSAFFEGTCAAELEFPPGRGTQYQSMGFVLLGEMIQRLTGQTCGDFVRDEIFLPLKMHDTVLGAPDDWFAGTAPLANRIAEIVVPDEQIQAEDWNWNSRYWRQLGAPWGGMLSTPNDLAAFAQAMLGDGGPFSSQTLAAATENQLTAMGNISESDRRTRPWGYGWRLNWSAHPATFGDLLGSQVIGHWGATGTLLWIDRTTKTACVILTTQPLERGRHHLVRLSNAVTASLVAPDASNTPLNKNVPY